MTGNSPYMRMFAAVAASAIVASFAGMARAQDISAVAITAPQGGCALGSSENVTIRLFNHDANLPAGTALNVAYTVNAGAPVVEMIVLGNALLSHSTLVYTFATPANLSLPGSYIFTATVALPGDVNPSNDAFNGHVVTNSAPSGGGIASGPGAPVLSGSVSLTGQTGAIVEWQQSEDGGRRWRRLANTSASQGFGMLLRDTSFRALVRNGACAPALSSESAVLSSDPVFYSGFEP